MEKKQKVHSLTGRIIYPVMLNAFKAVKRNRGAAGVDKVSIAMFEANLEENLTALIRIKIENKKITFKVNTDESIPSRLVGDALRLGQVLSNLTTNSVKFTDKGEVSVNIEIKEELESSLILLFRPYAPAESIITATALVSAGACMGFGGIGPGIGAGIAGQHALSWLGRSEEASGILTRTMLVGQAVSQSTSIYAMVIALVLIFVI